MNPKNINRRKFIKKSLSAGAVAGGALLLGNKDTLANTLMELSNHHHWQVTIDGKVVKKGNFSSKKEEHFIPVENGKAHIVIDGNRILVHEDSHICERKICAKMGSIREAGESIICKPNKLVVTIL